MKKFFLVCTLISLFGMAISPLYAQTPAEACRKLQKLGLDNLENVKSCSINASYGLSPAYLFKGIENGKCHYSKIEFGSGLKINVLAECYAPISTIQNFANDNIRGMQDMCDENGISISGYTAKENEATLEKYCK